MRELAGGESGLRFLPAVWLPAGVLAEIETALCQVGATAHASGASDVERSLVHVSDQLSRHSGAPEEVCMVTKSAALDMAAELTGAARLASRHGLAAAAFALAGIESRLLELLVDAQPMAST